MKNVKEAYYQGVYEYGDYAGPVRDEADYLIIGSGSAGGTIAKVLAEGGKSVILIEEGPVFRPKDMTLEAAATLRRMFREAGLRTTRGNIFMPTMQPICYGGGSLVNSAICARPPAFVFDEWCRKYGLKETTLETLNPHFDVVEKWYNVHGGATEILGRKNLVFKEACDKMGISSEPTPRNEKGCKGCAQCFTGCPQRAKQSTDISVMPDAIRAGARVYTSIRGEAIAFSGRNVSAMRGHVVEPITNRETYEAEFKCKHLILAAGVIQSPVLLLRSGVPDASGQVGKNLKFHPGAAIMGIFNEEINPWFGATQGYHSRAYLEQGIKTEVLWSPPAVLAVRFPGFGHELKEYISKYKYMAPFDVISKGSKSIGRVVPRRKSWDPVINYSIHEDDFKILHFGLGVLGDMFKACGAHSLLTGINKIAPIIPAKNGGDIIRNTKLTVQDVTIAATHVFGTTMMGTDQKTSVVDEAGRLHGMDNLYVCDTGIMPEGSGVNPMFTGMALSHRIGTLLLKRT
jgi:choline dehydrogenase-like flavoprotein